MCALTRYSISPNARQWLNKFESYNQFFIIIIIINWIYDVSHDYSINSVKGSIYKHFKALCNLPN